MIRLGRLARRRKRTSTDSGLGLTELVVAMALLGIIAAIVFGLYLSATRTISQARSLLSNTREASNGMNEISRVIRAATENPVSGVAVNDPAFTSTAAAPITGESVTLYAYVNLTSSSQQPVKIRLALDSSRRLVETVWPATVLSPGFYGFTSTVPTSTRIMAGTVAPQAASGPSLFTYLLSDGSVLPPTGDWHLHSGTAAYDRGCLS
ncbi:prepilin-type N-terminal cleavage/methylation domain-containing protein [Cryobacterium breve]|uniref:Prepilin-type N-terminal cleavage/methylation domain-containing protein n=1 Tax=Cryobacterium breve TaxID=1259258 RepID=A0ABY7NFF3_9MICO|nr:prepilin-type N-terminal cleavage/methylation domain-containing protein [Cryobacterium breve]WBM81191.1 prepilin-type N-terminal cleavage/methylation domain-containing protein [Cryobacterium breve]